MKRRTLLGLGAAFIGTGVASYFYLDNESMISAPRKEGKVLCDFHAHLRITDPLEDVLAVIGTPGLVGITQRYQSTDYWTYESLIEEIREEPSFEQYLFEISVGNLAKYKNGYFARTQEVATGFTDDGLSDMCHLNVIGWNDADYFPNFEDPNDAIEAIKEKKGIITYNHPGSVPHRVKGQLIFRLPYDSEMSRIISFCKQVDLIEINNSHNINLYLPFIDNMQKADELAEKLVSEGYCDEDKHPSMIAASDAHHLEQVKTAGVYLLEESLQDVESMKSELLSGNFEIHASSISRWSFLKGIVFPRLGI